MSAREQDSLPRQGESWAAEHLTLEHLDPVDMTLNDTRVPRLCEAGGDGVEVAFEVLSEPAEAGQLGGGGGRFGPCRQLVALQVGEHVGEGADTLSECCHLRAVGQGGLEMEPVALGRGVEVGEDPAGDGAGRWRPRSDRLGLAAKSPADVVADVAVSVRAAHTHDEFLGAAHSDHFTDHSRVDRFARW
ncbi:hypothetical protein OHU11_00910 [Streptomyces sp. NBC_00257]|uniref:hypothetical protein n=1 Tax=unclassified Streptomyces TaxID=2593676 RepID=UPI0022511BA9|nr:MULTISPECIES: hypothetical protein [unclassified Streptomyces]MCX4869923.1 hypothetical protein [Streptomyces sp. NBC_00906]MCX4901086.1 hypothetical protein [Streptomyces sp. NBC_00892]MCX5426331.1 hypothetical protein [Streptomyces sp. NBC_00062]